MSTDNDTEELRKAAATLTNPEVAELVGVDPIPKALLGSLVEEAIPDGFRGLTYKREVDDLRDWLAACACSDDVVASDRVIATAGAWICDEIGQEGGSAGLQLARAIGAYFVHAFAFNAADAQGDVQYREEQKRANGGER